MGRAPGKRPTIDEAFPFDDYREGQRGALAEASEALYDDGKDVVILDLPTGTGKSPINTALCRQARSAFYTTPQKSLRQQLDADGGLAPHLTSLRARADYQCGARKGNDCSTCPINSDDEDSCMDHSRAAALTARTGDPTADAYVRPKAGESCRYWDDKERAMAADTALLTFSYLVVDGRLPTRTERETPVSGSDETIVKQVSFDDRELLVVDESHKLESQVASMHAGFEINEAGLPDPLGETLRDALDGVRLDVDRPTVDLVEDALEEAAAVAAYYLTRYAESTPGKRTVPEDITERDLPDDPVAWLYERVEEAPTRRAPREYMEHLASLVGSMIGENPEIGEPTASSGTAPSGLRPTKRLVEQVVRLFRWWHGRDGSVEWVVGYEAGAYGEEPVRLGFQPVDIGPFLSELVWSRAEKVVLSTATMPYRDDPAEWLERLGLQEASYAVVSRDMRFPVANRPIHTETTVGEISGGGFGGHREAIVETVRGLLDDHAGEKGLVHTVSYNRAETLAEELERLGPQYADRVRLHDPDFPAEVQLRNWKATDAADGEVFLSPACTDGVDLPGDHCRFQVLLKVPLPYLGDPRVRYLARGENDWQWYNEEALLDTVQSVGRGVRQPTDECDYYVLDANLNQSWRSVLANTTPPKWFSDSLDEGRA